MLSKKTKSIYEKHAKQFDAERLKTLIEKKWLDKFCLLCPKEAKILDAGCGAGEPIAHYLIRKGYDITGIDISESMIEISKNRFPEHKWLVLDMQNMNLAKKFDGIIGWHSFFHLTPGEQRATLKIFAKHLNQKGVLMLTVGPNSGEVIGHVCGDKVYHSSLSFEEYQDTLNAEGINIIEFVKEDPECNLNTILLAKKK